jgi:hypothetical protein
LGPGRGAAEPYSAVVSCTNELAHCFIVPLDRTRHVNETILFVVSYTITNGELARMCLITLVLNSWELCDES